jgi:hypothetical protein
MKRFLLCWLALTGAVVAGLSPELWSKGASRANMLQVPSGGAAATQCTGSGWTLIGHATAVGSAATPSINTAGANLFVVVTGDNGAGTVIDYQGATQGNTTYTKAVSGGSNTTVSIWYFYAPANTGPASNWIYYTATADTFEVLAFSGAAASPLDGPGSTAYGAAATLAAGSITPSTSGQLVVAGIAAQGTVSSISSPYVITDNQPYSSNVGTAAACQIQATAAATNPVWTMSAANPANAAIVSFK